MIILDNYARKLHDHYCGFEKKNTMFFLYEDPRSKSCGLINVCVHVHAYQKKNDGKKGKGLTGEEKGGLWDEYNKKIKENTNGIPTGGRGENLPEEKQA